MNNKYYKIAVSAVAILFCVGVFFLGRRTATPDPVEIVKYVEVETESKVDTSVIEEKWDGNFSDGNIRMLSAWYYADGVIEDEEGQLWATDFSIDISDFLLIWIADNHTPDNCKDDIIVKIWSEVYE